MKQYRITYNPYINAIEVEEYFDTGAGEWRKIGGDRLPALKNLLDEKKPIQNVGYKIIECIEEYNRDSSEVAGKYKLRFVGLPQDYYDFETIIEVYKLENTNCMLTEPVYEDGWDAPEEILAYFANESKKVEELDPIITAESLKERLAAAKAIEDGALDVLVVGMHNSGKSTLINALLGKELLPVSNDVETATVFLVHKSDENQISILTDLDDEVLITFKPELEYQYSGIQWIDHIIDDIKNKLKNEENGVEQNRNDYLIRQTVKCLNNECKNTNHEGRIKEISIGLSDFSIMGMGTNCVIKDLPGAKAKLFADEHKSIIREQIEKARDSIVIYVLHQNNANFGIINEFLDEIKVYDDQEIKDIRGHIDFERSIYVLNRVDNREEQLTTIEVAKREFEGKKVVLTNAKGAGKIGVAQSKSKIDPQLVAAFVETPNLEFPLIDLRDDVPLPKAYAQERIIAISEKVIDDCSWCTLKEAEERTGVPLLAGLLEEYVSFFSSVNKANSYYRALLGMIKVLEDEKDSQLGMQSKRMEGLKSAQDKKRETLKGDCSKKTKEKSDLILSKDKKDKLKADLSEKAKQVLTEITDIISKNNILERRHSKDKEEKKQWKQGVKDALNAKVMAKNGEVNNVANEIKITYLKAFKEYILQVLVEGDVDREETKRIDKKIEAAINSIAPDRYEPTAKFESSIHWFNFCETVSKKYKADFNSYWGEKVIDPIIEKLVGRIVMAYGEIYDIVIEDLDTYSHEIKSIQSEIDIAQQEIDALTAHIEKASNIKKACENVARKGRVR